MLGRQTVNVDVSYWGRRFIRNVLGQQTRTLTQSQLALSRALDEAPLFVADTRPAMFFGVPHVAAVLIIAAFGESIVFVGPIWALWVIVPWVLMRISVRTDYNAPRCMMLFAMTKMVAWEAYYWRGSSPAPFPVRPGKYPRGIWR